MRDQLITDLLKLSILAEKTKSLKVRQTAKMQAGKIRKQLRDSEIKYY